MTQAKMKIKKGDNVIVLTGKDKGKTGVVLTASPADSQLIVEGINIVTRHQKPTQTAAGAIVKKEKAIHVSNVALIDPKSGIATRVGYKIEADKKTRIARKSGVEV